MLTTNLAAVQKCKCYVLQFTSQDTNPSSIKAVVNSGWEKTTLQPPGKLIACVSMHHIPAHYDTCLKTKPSSGMLTGLPSSPSLPSGFSGFGHLAPPQCHSQTEVMIVSQSSEWSMSSLQSTVLMLRRLHYL